MFFGLRWYRTDQIEGKSPHPSVPANYSVTETLCSTLHGDRISQGDLQLVREFSEAKSRCKPTIVRLMYAILKTAKYFCKLCENYILKDRTPAEIVVEYCKRVPSTR